MWLDVFTDNPYGTNCWLLAAEGSDDAVVVDPGFEPARVHALLEAAGKRPVAVLATHAHLDHIGDGRRVRGRRRSRCSCTRPTRSPSRTFRPGAPAGRTRSPR